MTDVLMTADAVGGVWTYALDLADALASYDVRVHLATMGPPMSAPQRDAVAASAVATVHERECALEWMPDPWRDVDAAGEWLLALAAQLDVDVVHLNGYTHAALDWPAPVLVVAHSDVLSWWRAVHGTSAPRQWDTYRRRVTAGLTAADAVVAPTAAVAADLAREYAVEGVQVVPNFRRHDGSSLRPKQPLVAAAGRGWDEAKNLAALHRITPRLQWPVTVADGTLPPEEVADLLRRASVFAAPARYEPFGLGVLEAAQAGCALVLGDIASLREVWGDAAMYVDPRDDDDLADALERLAMDDRLRSDLAVAARRRAGVYTAERTVRGYLDAYQRLCRPVGAVQAR